MKDIKKSSRTYRRYIAGAKSYAEFFDAWNESQRSGHTVGFCPMMRTAYFWRPLIAVLRCLLIASTFAAVLAIWYNFSSEILVGIVVVALFVGLVWSLKQTATALGIKTYFQPEEVPLVFQWVKATHDGFCPLVTFIDDEEEENA